MISSYSKSVLGLLGHVSAGLFPFCSLVCKNSVYSGNSSFARYTYGRYLPPISGLSFNFPYSVCDEETFVILFTLFS